MTTEGEFDLTEFNEILANVCAATVSLPFDDVRLVRPALQALLDELEGMKQQLETGADTATAVDQSRNSGRQDAAARQSKEYSQCAPLHGP